jgi:CxxC motif-containing protein (DUF1111 family)
MTRAIALLLAPAAAAAALAASSLGLKSANAGDASAIEPAGEQAYAQPWPTLDAQQRERFAEGREMFHQRWVVAPSALGLWGRGPTSNGEVCTDCHASGGAGRPPLDPAEPMRSMLVRLSVAGRDAHGGPLPHPVYGDQLQFQGVLRLVPGEGEAFVTWRETTVGFADGATASLRAPVVRFQHLNFGPIEPDTMISPRVAPRLVGLGLLEAVAEDTLLEIAERQKAQGVAGRANRVWDVEAGGARLGRFGLKANQPSLRQQIASALIADLGITSLLYPDENCPSQQTRCRLQPPAARPELKPHQLDALAFYLRALAVPERRDPDDPRVRRGGQLFEQARCDVCHVPQLVTGNFAPLPQLSRQTIHPYTDLLLHDMGEGLADGRPEFEAGPRDWRTPPLWGLGLSEAVNGNGFLLHDGRARNVSEAILWHGGEAQRSRDAFARMSADERAALVAFVLSL